MTAMNIFVFRHIISLVFGTFVTAIFADIYEKKNSKKLFGVLFICYKGRMGTVMEHMEKNLFQIGEVTKVLGVTRRMLINYEELGLVTPAVRHDNRGFRYYSADNIVHIRLIRTLRNLGLSLSEIRSYFDDTTHLDEQISRLELLRNQLNQYIEQLHLRQAKVIEPEIHHVMLPGFTAFCREFHDADQIYCSKGSVTYCLYISWLAWGVFYLFPYAANIVHDDVTIATVKVLVNTKESLHTIISQGIC